MHIRPINIFNQSRNQNSVPKNNQASQTIPVNISLLAPAYRDYNINFKARLNRTPENFYDQKFNIDNMPDTVKKYLFEDFEERRHMPPAQLQREAFEYLKLADSVQDIKDTYPDEPLFAHLKEASDTKPSQGTLLLLKWDAQTSQTPIFKDKNNKSLTTYLLKKVYLEGKTIEELNKDFDNDATDAIKRELGVKDKKYFSYTNIHTLGIRYPKLPYYNSFLATRNDKEYIPPVRKTSAPVSEQTKEKLSAAMTKWWAGLNELERSQQIQKMLNGKEMSNSIFSKYQGQIMTIAAAHIGFSEKLSDIFAEKYSDEQFTIDFPVFSEQQREIMLEFWNKDPEFRTKYSDALQSTILEFETAYYSEDKTLLESLLNKALDLKEKVLNKAKEKRSYKREMQKLAPQPSQEQKTPPQQTAVQPQKNTGAELYSSSEINKLYRSYELNGLRLFTDSFKKEFMNFLTQNTTMRTRREIVAMCRGNANRILNLNQDELQKLGEKLTEQREQINDRFNRTRTLCAKTNDFIFNKHLFLLTGDPIVFTFERGDAMNYINKHKLSDDLLKRQSMLNADMKKLETFSKGKELEIFCRDVFKPNLIKRLNEGFEFYPEYSGYLATTALSLLADKQENDQYKDFLKNYNAAIKYLNDPAAKENAKNAIIEHMIVDYIYRLANKNKNSLNNSPDSAEKRRNMLERNYNIDLNSEYSLKEAFQQYFHKTETKYWPFELEDEFLNYSSDSKFINKDILIFFFATKFDKYKHVLNRLSERDKKIGAEIVKTLNEMLHENFEKKSPQKANAIYATMQHTLYDLTQSPDALTIAPSEIAGFIKAKHMERKLAEQKENISVRYDMYSDPLREETLENFYRKVFFPRLMSIFGQGPKYEKIPNLDNYHEVELLVVEALQKNDKEITYKLKNYLKDKSAYLRLLKTDTITDDAKDRLMEKLVINFERKIAVERGLQFHFIKEKSD